MIRKWEDTPRKIAIKPLTKLSYFAAKTTGKLSRENILKNRPIFRKPLSAGIFQKAHRTGGEILSAGAAE